MTQAPHSIGSVFMVVAPSGAGKSTLVNALLARDRTFNSHFLHDARTASRRAKRP